jgi:hypothetical protein
MSGTLPERAHLWFSLPVRCWCGEQHVLGLDDDDESSADDANAPDIDERIEARSSEASAPSAGSRASRKNASSSPRSGD